MTISGFLIGAFVGTVIVLAVTFLIFSLNKLWDEFGELGVYVGAALMLILVLGFFGAVNP